MSDKPRPDQQEAERLQDSLAGAENLVKDFGREVERRVVEQIDPRLSEMAAKLDGISGRLRTALFCGLLAIGLSLLAIALAIIL